MDVKKWSKWMNAGFASIPHLLLENYKKFHLSDEEMILIIHIHSFAQQGEYFPSIGILQQRMSCSDEQVVHMLHHLHQRNILDIDSQKDMHGKIKENFSLEPLWKKLMQHVGNTTNTTQPETNNADDASSPWKTRVDRVPINKYAEIYGKFEIEFGRPFSPYESEMIIKWIDEDEYEPKIILMALKEAVVSNKLSLRYIDKILLEWQRNGLTTSEQIQQHSTKFRKPIQHKKVNKEKSPFPFYNWLDK